MKKQFSADGENTLMRCSIVLQLLNQEPLKVYSKTQLFMDWTTNLAKKRSAKQCIKQNLAKLQDRTAYPLKFLKLLNQYSWTGFFLSSHKSVKLRSCHKTSKMPT